MKKCIFLLLLVTPAVINAQFISAGKINTDNSETAAATHFPAADSVYRLTEHAGIATARITDQWASYYGNGARLDEGKLVKGLPDGEWKVWYPDGQMRYIRTYSEIKWRLIRRELSAPVKHPLFMVTVIAQRDPARAELCMKPDLPYAMPGTKTSSTPGTLSVKYQLPFSRALQHGLYMNFAEDGVVTDSGYYRNGLREDIWLEKTSNTISSTGEYEHGLKDQEWKFYNKAGELLYIIFYREGKEKYRKNIRMAETIEK